MFRSGKDGMTPEELSAVEELTALYNLLFGDDDLGCEAELCEHEDEDDEGPLESLLRRAPEIEAGLIPGWKLDRCKPGSLLWTTPSGRRYESTLDGSSYTPYRR